jgi:hypothetical protein
VRVRLVVLLVAFALLLVACGDDGGTEDPAAASTPSPVTTGVTASTVGPSGPSAGAAACAGLANRYVRRARVLFDRDGSPSDALVDQVRSRLTDFDTIAVQAGCGQEYTTAVCEGLDALTAQGILVIIPLTTAQCL